MKLKEFIKTWAWQILAGLFFLLYMGKGCTSKKVGKINMKLDNNQEYFTSKIDSMTNRITSLEEHSASKKETKDIMERVMLDYLLYEDDLDRGKTSLSEIKNKIEQND